MSDFSLFLGKFLRHGTAIASLAPSSPWLSRTTVRNVDWAAAGVVVELGAGTGPITRVLAEQARPDCRVVVLERDPDFARLLRERFADLPNFDVIEGDVRDLAAILADRGIGQVDHVDLGPARPLVPQGPPARPLPGRPARSSPPTGRTTRSPRCPGSTGGSTAGSSTTSGSSSSRGTSRRPGPTSAGA